MRILVVTNKFPRLSEKFVIDHVTHLLDRGYDVDILSFFKPKPEPEAHAEVEAYQLNKRLLYVECPQNKIQRLWKVLGILVRYGISYSREIRRCLHFKKYGRFEAVNRLFYLEPFLRRPYDVVHCHFGQNALRLLFLKEIIPIKLITTFHGFDITSFVKENGTNCYRELFLHGDQLVSVSDYFRDKLIELGAPSEKIHVIYSGVDTNRFSFKERKFDFNNQIRLLSMGRLVEKKGFAYTLQALSHLVRQFPHIRLTIIGDGPEKENLKRLAHELRLEHVVTVIPALNHDRLKEHFRNSDIFVLPSVTALNGDQEGIPNVLKEAMLTGMPVVSTVHSGIPELIANNKTGMAVPERDPNALSSAIADLIQNPDKCKALGSGGRDIVLRKFDNKLIIDQLIKLYESTQKTHEYTFVA